MEEAVTRQHAHPNTVFHCLYGYYSLGYTKKELARVYNKAERTIGNWIQVYETTGSFQLANSNVEASLLEPPEATTPVACLGDDDAKRGDRLVCGVSWSMGDDRVNCGDLLEGGVSSELDCVSISREDRLSACLGSWSDDDGDANQGDLLLVDWTPFRT